jgi:hypothetical protein
MSSLNLFELPHCCFKKEKLQVQAAVEDLAVAVHGVDTQWSSLLETAIFHFSFLRSCFICSSLHSKLQNAVSPLKSIIILFKSINQLAQNKINYYTSTISSKQN